MSKLGRSLRWLLALLTTSIVLAPALPAFADDEEEDEATAADESGPQAVKAWNLWLEGQYLYDERELPPNAFRNDDTERDQWRLTGNAVFPVLRWLGARVSLDGGQQSVRSGFDATRDSETGGIGAALDLFWRDPGLGSVSVGYAITHQETHFPFVATPGTPVSGLRPFSENIQTLTAEGALYLGDIDVEGVLGVSPRTAATITPQNADETGARSTTVFAGAGARYYLIDWLAVRADFSWARDERAFLALSPVLPPTEIGQSVTNTYEGRVAVETQLPTIGRGPFFLSFSAAVGGDDVDLPLVYPDRTLTWWQVGGSLVLTWPRPESIKEWVRAYR